MNNKAQVMIYAMMVGLVIIILALALAPSVVEFNTTARNASSESSVGLDCNNASISNFDKATCRATDLTSFYFIGTLICIGGAFVVAKIVFS